jgi:hypothetical protein
MRALRYEHVSGWLPPKRAAKVRQWIGEAETERAMDQMAAGSPKPERASVNPELSNENGGR